jgi:hypothetical protein
MDDLCPSRDTMEFQAFEEQSRHATGIPSSPMQALTKPEPTADARLQCNVSSVVKSRALQAVVSPEPLVLLVS